MNLVEMKCKNCGAKLEINNETKEATCRFCGMTFKIDGELNATKEAEEKIDRVEPIQMNDIIKPQDTEAKKEEKIDHSNIGPLELIDELKPGGNKKLSDISLKTRLKAIALAAFIILSGNEVIKALDNRNKDNVDNNQKTLEFVSNVDLSSEEQREVDRQIEFFKEESLRKQREEEARVKQIEEQSRQEIALNEELEMLQKMLLDYDDRKTGIIELGKEELRQALMDGKTQSELEAIASLYGIALDPNYYESMNEAISEFKQSSQK